MKGLAGIFHNTPSLDNKNTDGCGFVFFTRDAVSGLQFFKFWPLKKSNHKQVCGSGETKKSTARSSTRKSSGSFHNNRKNLTDGIMPDVLGLKLISAEQPLAKCFASNAHGNEHGSECRLWMARPEPIVSLSDDEPGDVAAQLPAPLVALPDDEVSAPPAPIVARPPPQRKKKRSEREEIEQVGEQRRRLLAAVSRSCKCKDPDCRRPFRDDHSLFSQLLRKRLDIINLDKRESDCEVSWI